MFYFASFLSSSCLSTLNSLKWYFKRNHRYHRKWQYAQCRFNRIFFLQVSDDVYCEVCQCRFRKADRQYPCRICEGVFHRDCVLGITDVHPSHASTIERASSKIGWSCPACVSYIVYLSIVFFLEFPLLLYTCIPFQNRAFYSYAKDCSLTFILLHTHVRNIVLYNLRRMLLYHMLTVCNKCSFYI